ncbi:MAG: hypothetical protein V1734_02210 [Nanoarchaeota archaeon]
MDIVPETINRIRLSDNELILLKKIIDKIKKEELSPEEEKFYRILRGRVEGRLKLKQEDID